MDLFAPSSVGVTLLTLPIAAGVGWAYGFVGHVGYSKQVMGTDAARTRAGLIGLAVALGLLIFFRHGINSQLRDGLTVWFQDTLHNSNPILILFLGLPLALLVMAAGLTIMVGGFGGAVYGIGWTLYYLPGFLMGLPIVFNWFFVKHPAEPIVSSALESGSALQTQHLRESLTPRPSDLRLVEPAYHYEHQAERARALAAKLDEDARIAEAATRRERARAALEEAEQELADVQRRGQRGGHERR
jgi:hypothetical protein